jgi:hypothetical protein
VREFAAFCAAEKTLLKKPVGLGFGVIDLFSGVGVRGADVMLASLLGPNVVDVDLTRRCDIMFPEGDVMTLGFEAIEPGVPRSDADGKRGTLESVGVGGVFTMSGAVSVRGGVRRSPVVSIGRTWGGVRGGSVADHVVIVDAEARLGVAGPVLDATVPRCRSKASLSWSLSARDGSTAPPPALRSGLDC